MPQILAFGSSLIRFKYFYRTIIVVNRTTVSTNRTIIEEKSLKNAIRITAKVLNFGKPSYSHTIECVGLESGYVVSLTKYDSPRN